MKTDRVARKYLNLIVLLVLILAAYQIWSLTRSGKTETSSAPKNDQERIQKVEETEARMNSYVSYLNETVSELKALESSASIDITEDLQLTQPYLDNFLNK